MNYTFQCVVLLAVLVVVYTQGCEGHSDDIIQQIEVMQKQLNEVKLQEESSRNEITELKAEAKKSNKEITELKAEVMKSNKEITELKAETTELKADVMKSNKEVQKVKQTNILLNSQVHNLELENKHLKSDVHKALSESHQNTFVGFTAYATASRPYNNEELVVFDAVHTNYGGNYNPQLSVFQCPIAGYYMFFINIFTHINHSMRPEIYIDGEQTTFARTFSDDSDDDSSSTMVITYCEVNQLVWVRNTADNDEMYGNTDDPLSSFSGALLAAVAT